LWKVSCCPRCGTETVWGTLTPTLHRGVSPRYRLSRVWCHSYEDWFHSPTGDHRVHRIDSAFQTCSKCTLHWIIKAGRLIKAVLKSTRRGMLKSTLAGALRLLESTGRQSMRFPTTMWEGVRRPPLSLIGDLWIPTGRSAPASVDFNMPWRVDFNMPWRVDFNMP
jgi:hypothetical protein